MDAAALGAWKVLHHREACTESVAMPHCELMLNISHETGRAGHDAHSLCTCTTGSMTKNIARLPHRPSKPTIFSAEMSMLLRKKSSKVICAACTACSCQHMADDTLGCQAWPTFPGCGSLGGFSSHRGNSANGCRA